MPDQRKPEKKKRPPSSEDIQVPPISKQTACAVTGAAIGSIAGPAGAVVGGVIGAVVGKAAADGRPVGKAVRRVTVATRGARQRPQLKKSPTKSRKGDRQRLHAKTARKTRSRRSSAARPHKRTMRPTRKPIRSGQRLTSSRAKQKPLSGRTKKR
jgi:hypothetical protein